MAIYTPLSLADAQRLAEPYGLDVVACEGLIAGSVNSNHALTLDDGVRVFARIYEEQSADGARDEAALLDHLAARGLPVALPLARGDGTTVTEHAGKPVALFPWVDGAMRCQATVSERDAATIGGALARIHLAGSPRPRPGRFRVDDLRTRCDHIAAHGGDLASWAPTLRAALDEVESRRHPDAHRGLCHGDLFRDNVLWRDSDLAALLDFESAADERFAFDLAVTLLAWTYGGAFSPPLARALVAGYQAVRPLPPVDRVALFTEARLAALRFTITRITDYAMRAHLGANTGRDFRRFWVRYTSITEMGADGWEALVGV